MSHHIDYRCLRGRVYAVDRAKPDTNPHLWLLLKDDQERLWFTTINVRSKQDALDEPLGKSFLLYLVDTDFKHPIVPSILACPSGLTPIAREFVDGAIDYQRGNLFDPAQMRVLPMEGDGDDNLVHRLKAMFEVAKASGHEVIVYGNAFAKDNPHQTDEVFGMTPTTVWGLDNIHMAQGDPRDVDVRLHENAVWHDGAAFIWDATGKRMSAIFLAFQAQAWHTDELGRVVSGATGAEAPHYDFSQDPKGLWVPPPKRAAEITSVHRAVDGAGTLVIANMSAAVLDLTGWSLLSQSSRRLTLPTTSLEPGRPLSVALPAGELHDSGGIVTLVDAAGLRVDGVAYVGGDASGWSTSFG